ncbi:ATP-binding protein [Paenibacillus sp. LHD-117]|uniref:ATP-binding protein n=1 Tax=Paenibacillus sp. LHD-117 TaxID=3071412 RepID=UPI0027E04E9A|nr:ATP-binding protein [Paenibacillus sp. LHD-117]MDQ6419650.1 ATP-binding protein [Paenibacillus sp. LHD-117]
MADQGVLDLSGWDFREQGLADLNGQWEFVEGELASASRFGEQASASYLSVPGTWQGKNEEGGMSRKGFGTYRLKVIVPASDELYGLKVRSIRMAHRLFVDGKEIGGSGRPGIDVTSQRPGNTPYSAYFHAVDREVEIMIQAANYEYVTGGIVNPILIGLPEDITQASVFLAGADIAIILILAMFGAYHVSLFFLRKREKTYLFSGLYLYSLMLVQLLYGEKIGQRLLPQLSFEVAYKLLDGAQYASMALIVLFLCSIDTRLLQRRTIAVILSPIALMIAGLAVLPYSTASLARIAIYPYIILIVWVIIARMTVLYLVKARQSSGKRELFLFVLGCISLSVYQVGGSLYSENIVSTDAAAMMGIVSFIICMNVLLATRFVHAYGETEKLARELAATNERKDEFWSQTSLELKTPLQGILNLSSDLLADEERGMSAVQRRDLSVIKDTSVKLTMLVNNLIDVTRLKHGELSMRAVAVDVRVAAQIVCDDLRSALVGKEVELENLIAEGTIVLADENRLRQVLYNLVHNAIKHTDKGTIRLTSNVQGSAVRIGVQDSGDGIDGARVESIFGHFEQAESAGSSGGNGGMGVGLYLSRKLVERMGGELAVEWTEIGRGTRMAFTLPAAESLIPQAAQGNARAEIKTGHDAGRPPDILDSGGSTVLIVDDEPANIHTLMSMLRRNGYNVVTAYSAKEAISKMRQHPQVDLAIIDVMMPDLSGTQLCRMLREQHSILDLPILLATAKDMPRDIALAFQAGANDYVTKPFDGETLLARIHTLLAMKASIREAIRNEQAFHQAQIKPHFLYNALSSVISFCYIDGEKAAHLLIMLSQYLRYVLDMDRMTLVVPLYQELELVEAYVEIEKARFGDSISFECVVAPELRDCPIPPLCIQPFVENAIRHGIFEKNHGHVSLRIDEGDGYLKVVVEDDGIGIPDDLLYRLTKGSGKAGSIGITNIRKRLASMPGASFQIDSAIERGTKVTIYLPCE